MRVETNLNIAPRQPIAFMAESEKNQMEKIERAPSESSEKFSNFNRKALQKVSIKTWKNMKAMIFIMNKKLLFFFNCERPGHYSNM